MSNIWYEGEWTELYSTFCFFQYSALRPHNDARKFHTCEYIIISQVFTVHRNQRFQPILCKDNKIRKFQGHRSKVRDQCVVIKTCWCHYVVLKQCFSSPCALWTVSKWKLEAFFSSTGKSECLYPSCFFISDFSFKFLRPSWWPCDFSPLTVVFTALWPLITHWLVHLYLQRKRRWEKVSWR